MPGGLAPEAQTAVLAWVMQMVQAGQADALRRQGEFQHALTQVVRQICLENATLLSEHLARLERVNQEIASLREEIRQRLGGPGEAMPMPGPGPGAAALPKGLEGNAAGTREAAQPRVEPPAGRVEPPPPAGSPEQATRWLLERVQQLEAENQSTWKSLLQRLGAKGSGGTR
jgi:hypothetical protein